MRLHIGGHYWNYSEPRTIHWEGHAIDGVCIRSPRREIRVSRRLKGRTKAETQLHELTHAVNFSSSEQWVTTFSSAATALCYSGGVGLCKTRDRPSGAEVLRQGVFHALRIGRHDLDDDHHLQTVADDLTRALLRLGWRQTRK